MTDVIYKFDDVEIIKVKDGYKIRVQDILSIKTFATSEEALALATKHLMQTLRVYKPLTQLALLFQEWCSHGAPNYIFDMREVYDEFVISYNAAADENRDEFYKTEEPTKSSKNKSSVKVMGWGEEIIN